MPKAGGGRIGVCEILRATSRTREYVQEGEREGKSLIDAMEDGALDGMQTFDGELERLINAGVIDREVGLSYATNRTNLQLMLETGGSDVGPTIAAKPKEPVRRRRRRRRRCGPRRGRPPPPKATSRASKTSSSARAINMQATCATCATLLEVDDTKAPQRAFTVTCPKCKGTVDFRRARASSRREPRMRPVPPPILRPKPSVEMPPLAGRMLVAVPNPQLVAAIDKVMTRMGLIVETTDDWETGARLMDQGVYEYAVTVRALAAAGKTILCQRTLRMPAEVRRGFFLILAGDGEFATGDGTQAFALLADFVLNSADIATMEPALRDAIDERHRMYQAMRDARKRIETVG